MRFKKFLLVGSFVAIGALLSGCQDDSAGPGDNAAAPDSAATKTVNLKVAHAFPKAEPSAQMLQEWERLVSERTEGRITFTNYWAQSLTPLKDAVHAARQGIADVAMVTSSYASGTFPDLAPLEIPFALPEDPAARAKVQDQINKIIDAMFRETANQKVLFGLVHPPSLVTCKDGFLPDSNSWEGKIVRTPGGFYAGAFERLGASLSFIPLQDIYLSLQMDTVDCALLVYTAMAGMKIYEVSPYATRIDHSNLHSVITINLDQWKSLSPSDQRILMEAGKEVESLAIENRGQTIEDSMSAIVKGGGRFCTPDQEVINAIRAAALAELEELRYEAGSYGQQFKDTVLGAWSHKEHPPEVGSTLSEPCS
jgi:TRAP-type C4-dicarboxylate transport system substrate-binding protein